MLQARSILHVHDGLHILKNGEKQLFKVHAGLPLRAPGVPESSFHDFVMSVGRLLKREKCWPPLSAAAVDEPPPVEILTSMAAY